MGAEVWSVTDDEAVVFDGSSVEIHSGLASDTTYQRAGLTWRTLPRPDGALLATVTAVNDLHFGETTCGLVSGMDLGPGLSSPAGAPPYPIVMNTAAAAEMDRLDPVAVVVKGDVTAAGSSEEYRAFETCYRPTFAARLHVIRGNHDNPAPGPAFDAPPFEAVEVPGAVLALLDTSRPGEGGGFLDAGQLHWLDDLAAAAETPVLVFGHHPCFQPGATDWVGDGSHLGIPDSAALVEVVARRPAIVGYFAGHTHRNRVRRFEATGQVPFAEVGSVKDFPGSWAEYRIHEGGILQIHRRLAEPAALAWSEECRALFAGLYPAYAAGEVADRCFALPTRR